MANLAPRPVQKFHSQSYPRTAALRCRRVRGAAFQAVFLADGLEGSPTFEFSDRLSVELLIGFGKQKRAIGRTPPPGLPRWKR